MAFKRVQDIVPPGKRREAPAPEEPKEESKKQARLQPAPRSFNVFGVGIGITLMLLLGGALATHFLFASATVLVWPEKRTMLAEERVTAAVGTAAVDYTASIIPAVTFAEEQQLSRLFSSSGQGNAEGKATGTIRVYNGFSKVAQKLVANTRFMSENGKLFRSTEQVMIPGATQQGSKLAAGSIDVAVVAAEAGESYNIGASNFSLPGLQGAPSYSTIYGKSTEPMRGGSSSAVASVTKTDLQSAKETLVQEATQKAKEALQQKIGEQFVLLPDAVSAEVKEAFSAAKEGAQLDQFSFSVTVTVQAPVFLKADILALATKALQGKLQEGEQAHEPSIAVAYDKIRMNSAAEGIGFTLKVSTFAFRILNAQELVSSIAGKPKQAVALLLADYPLLAQHKVSLWPFWLQTLPQDAKRVNLSVVIDE